MGLVLSPDNMEKIVQELLELRSNPQKLNLWKRNAYHAYKDYFSKQRVMNQWDSVLREELEHRRKMECIDSRLVVREN